MGILDRFKKITNETKETAPKRLEKKKLEKKEAKNRKAREEEAKKKQFMAVGAAAPERKEEEKKSSKSGSVSGGEEKSPDKKKPQKMDTKQAPRLLMKPVISEKATSLAVDNKYVFAVSNAANKIEIKKAIQNLYGVTAFKVNIMQIKGKNVRYGRTEGVTKNWKKAVITLPPGQKIDVYNP